ncbi:hypothetical protein CH63R_08624 [Colletotrichum higginsianum IMI 349063]|uniref:Uncharacterized protein n=2 Tax=Colletotrichum higginsianum TaxID=80884 RepID=A0A1B7Y536_COLHI|nr:hypothetical protein CH63R_08624 [Colletotrichum higginsianum IMI 349063]OBR07103.1 hypothetical protein CH63R_08624 [Colletotrichum higginsianum IMI 349063]TIC92921.1 hypothetical protein CH35J_010106 [Colletotrichum higginsianum]
MVGQLAVAAPLVDAGGPKTVVEFRTVNKVHAVKAALEERANTCQKIAHTLRTIGTSAVAVVSMSTGSDLAEVVCRLAGGLNCEDWAKAIRLGFLPIYSYASYTSGAVPETGMRRDIYGDFGNVMLQGWESAFIDSGLVYASIEVLPHDAEDAALERRDGDPKLLTRIHFSGVVDSETGRKHEIIANYFEGNNTVLHLPALEQAAMASRDLSKCVGATGFKISYTTRAQSLLTRSHQQEMSGYIASAWSIAAENYRLEDYIGLAKTDHNANFYWRIIPELYGFGLNYESVDVCGGMAGYL